MNEQIKLNMRLKILTPSEARTMNWSLSVSNRWENSGIEITPYSFKQKSPNARAIANPGASSKGNHTLWTSGSSCNANTLPLHRLILSASPTRICIQNWTCLHSEKTQIGNQ